MANLLQSSQTQATQAPSFYTNYLSNLATQGQQAAGQAQYVGAQPLQTQAFCAVATNFGAAQPAFQKGQGYVGQAAGQNVAGAASPYLQAGTNASPLCAARPLICQTANLNLSCLAANYMSPYIQTAVQGMSDIAQRNIRNNLLPAATAAAVGSGQFGSQRGAQVLGQINAQAQQDLNAQIANMQNQGYAQALQAATAKQGALSNISNTAANAQAAQNQANLTAAQTAAQAAANQGQLLNAAGLNMGTLGTGAANTNLACINALATLGGQQQTIGQNAQNFPLTNLASLSNLLQGYSIPTSTQTTLCMSPFSAAAALGSGALGLVQAQKYDSAGKPIAGSSFWDQIKNTFSTPSGTTTANSGPSNVEGSSAGEVTYVGTNPDGSGLYWNPSTGGYQDSNGNAIEPYLTDETGCASGGRVQSKAIGGMVGGLSCQITGGMPTAAQCSGMICNASAVCTPYMAVGGIAKNIMAGRVGCSSTQYRGGLPSKG